MDIKSRLLEYIRYREISIKQFEENCGMSNGYISSMRKGMGISKLENVLNFYNDLNREWLLYGEGEMLKTASLHNEAVSTSILNFKEKGYSPYYADMPAGAGQHDLATVQQETQPVSWIKIPNVTAEAWFPVIGCSMEPKIYAGDTIGVVSIDRWDKLDPDKIYLVITREDRIIKHLEMDSDDSEIIWAVSENYKKIKLHHDDIKHVYHVVFVGRLL